MKSKTRITIVCLLMFASIQFLSCKKNSAGITNAAKASISDNAIADSTTDSTLTKGLIAWYPFNGDTKDHSGHHNNVIYNTASPVRGKAGIASTAYQFDGISSYMQVANSKLLNPSRITLFALFKTKGYYSGTCHYNRIINKGVNDGDYGRYVLGYSDQYYYNYEGCFEQVQENFENPFGSYGDGQATVAGATADSSYILKGRWYTLAYVYNGTESKLYLNGKLISIAKGTTTFTPNETPVFFGRTQDSQYPYYFNGIIDEIRIYNRALNATEVARLNTITKN
jgi:hypothetical protein